jgi:RimJ/RimL family protein N-acetyltransferase
MSFVNLYQPPSGDHADDETYGPDPYDINFCFPLNPNVLSNDRIELVPFVPRVHAATFWDEFGPVGTELMRLMPTEWPTYKSMLRNIECNTRMNIGCILFAVHDKTREGKPIAGVIGLHGTSPSQLLTMLSSLITLPHAQRTHVTTHAVGLLLRYVLDTPEQGGLGLRRVIWRAHPDNAPSIAVAKRFEFQDEGSVRWARVVEEGREGLSPRKGDPLPHKRGRHAVQWSLCWDDWEGDVRHKVAQLLERL